jgi:hypothetical protein
VVRHFRLRPIDGLPRISMGLTFARPSTRLRCADAPVTGLSSKRPTSLRTLTSSNFLWSPDLRMGRCREEGLDGPSWAIAWNKEITVSAKVPWQMRLVDNVDCSNTRCRSGLL